MSNPFHPVTWVLTWGFGVIALQCFELPYLLPSVSVLLLISLMLAPRATVRLLRRAQWLLLTLAIMFLWMTPGVRIDGPAGLLGITWEGLTQALEHLLRLIGIIVGLGMLIDGLGGIQGVIAGLYELLSPMGVFCADCRHRLVARLMLTLETVTDLPSSGGWRQILDAAPRDEGPDSVTLHLPAWHWYDTVWCSGLVLGAIAAIAAVWLG